MGSTSRGSACSAMHFEPFLTVGQPLTIRLCSLEGAPSTFASTPVSDMASWMPSGANALTVNDTRQPSDSLAGMSLEGLDLRLPPLVKSDSVVSTKDARGASAKFRVPRVRVVTEKAAVECSCDALHAVVLQAGAPRRVATESTEDLHFAVSCSVGPALTLRTDSLH